MGRQPNVLGGGISGGTIFNDLPESLLEGSDQDAGRGKLIPKYPWESVMIPIAEWMWGQPELGPARERLPQPRQYRQLGAHRRRD